MDKNDIKKMLYKQKPDAIFMNATNSALFYTTSIELENEATMQVGFIIPHKDIGDAKFEGKVPSQLLIRWII